MWQQNCVEVSWGNSQWKCITSYNQDNFFLMNKMYMCNFSTDGLHIDISLLDVFI